MLLAKCHPVHVAISSDTAGGPMFSVPYRTPLAVSCAAALLVACSKGERAGDSARVTDSTAVAATATSAMTPTAPAMSDGNVLAMLDEANVADSTTGSIAAAKGTSADVKAYGRDMMRDHHALRVDGQDLAKKSNISPAMPAGDNTAARDKALTDSLTAMPRGAAWDKFYIDHAVMHHQEVLAMAQNGMNAAQNADLKAMIAKASPIVQQHLDRAKQLQSRMQ
jgi:putative membrane protein